MPRPESVDAQIEGAISINGLSTCCITIWRVCTQKGKQPSCTVSEGENGKERKRGGEQAKEEAVEKRQESGERYGVTVGQARMWVSVF